MENLTLTLTVQAWDYILNVLAKRPFEECAGLISEIKRQADEQINLSVPKPETAEE